MIPETENILENIQCPDCGSAVRPGASFCFQCGKHFEVVGAPAPENTAENEEQFQDTIPDSGEAAPAEEGEMLPAAPAAEDKAENEVGTVAASVAGPAAIRAKPPLTSAATMRRKPKPQREKIEMVWEQPEGTSNPVFVIGTIVIFVLVLLVVLLVYFLK